MSVQFKGGEKSDKKFLLWLNHWTELSSDWNMLLRLSADWKLSTRLHFSLTYLTGWRRCRKRRLGWCAAAGCARCYWWRRRWRRRATRPLGRAWPSAPFLPERETEVRYQLTVLRNIHPGTSVCTWKCYLLRMLAVFSVVISISGSVKYSDATHLPFSGPERERETERRRKRRSEGKKDELDLRVRGQNRLI